MGEDRMIVLNVWIVILKHVAGIVCLRIPPC